MRTVFFSSPDWLKSWLERHFSASQIFTKKNGILPPQNLSNRDIGRLLTCLPQNVIAVKGAQAMQRSALVGGGGGVATLPTLQRSASAPKPKSSATPQPHTPRRTPPLLGRSPAPSPRNPPGAASQARAPPPARTVNRAHTIAVSHPPRQK